MSDTLGVGITFHVDQEAQGLKKVLPVIRDKYYRFSHWVRNMYPIGKGPGKSSSNKSLTTCTMIKKWPQASKRRELLTQKDKLEFKFFSSPVVHAILHVCQ